VSSAQLDAVVVGSGPNGLSAAITLAMAGRSVRVYEAAQTIGGGARSAELTAPGFVSDVCSAIHPFAAASPFFKRLPLEKYGLEWIQPDIQLAHPLDDGTAAVLDRSLKRTARGFGEDGRSYYKLMRPYVRSFDKLAESFLGPIIRMPPHPILMARFGLDAVRSAKGINRRFEGQHAPALFGGMSAHATLPLNHALTASFGLILGAAGHAVGWPIARTGSQAITDALAALLSANGGEIVANHRIRAMGDLPAARAYLFDVTPRQLLAICGDRLSAFYRRQLMGYRYGAGIFKVDYALDGPVPWTAEACRRAGTVHLGGTFEEVAEAEATVSRGKPAEKPFVIAAQQSLFDPTRAPEGKQVLWAYCHVPNGSGTDMTAAIEAQFERFAPGFKDRIIARGVIPPRLLQEHNDNYIGGDIAGGSTDGLQLFFRPAIRVNPYSTPADGIYICSSSTPPGPGVHGMSGYWAAKRALRGALR
jgi:phytoene dehydrogenase-like protein